MNTLFTHLAQIGTPQYLTVNTPFLLDKPEVVWWIASGSINLYTVELNTKGEVAGKRYYFRHIPTQGLLMGMPTQTAWQTAFLADATEDSVVFEITLKDLKKIIQKADFQEDIAILIQQWVEHILYGLAENSNFPDQQADLLVAPQEKWILRKGEKVASQKGVLWCKIKQPEGLLFNGSAVLPPFPNNAPCFAPIATRAYLEAPRNVGMQALTTKQVITEDYFWLSWAYLAQVWFEIEKTEIELVRQQERSQNERKYTQQFWQTQQILQQTATILEENSTAQFKIRADFDSSQPLVNACQMILQHLGIKMVMPPQLASSPDALGDIMRFSKVRYREVLLSDTWWQKDIGILLCFDKETQTPLVIIANKKNQYEAYNLQTDSSFIINESTAKQLDKLAYTFYKPFPDKPLRLSDLAQIAFFQTRTDLVRLLIAGFLGAGLNLLLPILTGILIDFVIPQADGFQLAQLALVLLSATLALTLFEITENYALLRIEIHMDNRLEAALWDRLLKLPANFFRQYNVGDLAERTKGIAEIRKIVSGIVITTCLAGIFSVLNFLLLFYYSTFLAFFALSFTLFEVLLMFALGRWQILQQRQTLMQEGKVQSIAWQMIQGIAKFRVMGAEIRAFNRWFRFFLGYKKSQVQNLRLSNAQAWFSIMLPLLSTAGLYTLVMQYQLFETLSTGHFLAFYAAYTAFAAALLAMNQALLSVYQALPLFERVQPILTHPLEIDQQKASPNTLKGNIEINQVTFRYHPDAPAVLQDISLNIQAGEYVAFVGASGSGKSTLIRLLLGFEKPETGSIFYDKQDLSLLDLRLVRQQIGVVLQEGALAPGDILTNIIGSSVHLGIDDAWKAAELAAVAEDIKQMPMQMHTIISEGATNLSGGQKQRLLIAQTLVHKPRILIFDEATSALDNHTQAVITQSLNRLQATRIVVAHRLSTIKEVDKIFVFDKGQIVQVGSFKELMAQEGLFKELANRQIA